MIVFRGRRNERLQIQARDGVRQPGKRIFLKNLQVASGLILADFGTGFQLCTDIVVPFDAGTTTGIIVYGRTLGFICKSVDQILFRACLLYTSDAADEL